MGRTKIDVVVAGIAALVALLALALIPLGAGAKLVVTLDDCPDLTVPCGDWTEIARWVDSEVLPLPEGRQPSLASLRTQGGSAWSSFRAPFPSVPVWNPPGPQRVGLQAGHWQYDQSPDELADLRSNPGTSGGGMAEWEVTLDIARRTAVLLREAGVEADALPTTIPVRYRAHAFVAIHADGDPSGVLTGYKATRPGFSSAPEVDDQFAEVLSQQYGAATGLQRQDAQVPLRMRWYYAFNARRYQHAVAPGVPQTILETGFLTNWSDRRILLGNPDLAARGIANGVLRFLHRDSAATEGE